MSRSSGVGRHRLGSPHLRHCREIPAVGLRLETTGSTRHLSDDGRWRVRPSLAIGAGLAAAVVSGWFTAGEALAQQLIRH